MAGEIDKYSELFKELVRRDLRVCIPDSVQRITVQMPDVTVVFPEEVEKTETIVTDPNYQATLERIAINGLLQVPEGFDVRLGRMVDPTDVQNEGELNG